MKKRKSRTVQRDSVERQPPIAESHTPPPVPDRNVGPIANEVDMLHRAKTASSIARMDLGERPSDIPSRSCRQNRRRVTVRTPESLALSTRAAPAAISVEASPSDDVEIFAAASVITSAGARE